MVWWILCNSIWPPGALKLKMSASYSFTQFVNKLENYDISIGLLRCRLFRQPYWNPRWPPTCRVFSQLCFASFQATRGKTMVYISIEIDIKKKTTYFLAAMLEFKMAAIIYSNLTTLPRYYSSILCKRMVFIALK